MSEREMITALAKEIATYVRPSIPIDVDLWDAEMIASFLKVSTYQVQTRIAPLAGFPQAIRINNGHPRWKAKEVIEWAYQQTATGNRPGRPRKKA